jgi:glutathione synthase/RimK-type ligase-like ATP-grasp enzyme
VPVDGDVLVLSQHEDETARPVVEELERRGVTTWWFDTASFPQVTSLVPANGLWGLSTALVTTNDVILLNRVASIWFRWPGAFRFRSDMARNEQKFADREARMAIGGLLRCVDCRWVNHPDNLMRAEYKALQLKIAAEYGMTIPKSLITNDPDTVVRFFKTCGGRMIYKPLSGGQLPTADGTPPESVYTSIVGEDELANVDAVRNTACLFQEYIPRETELRLTIIGDEVFPVEIDSPDETVDWRRVDDLVYTIHRLPDHIRQSCRRLMGRLGLHFAAMDMIVTPQGDYVFLELNPNGQWLWLERETGLPMTQAMADLLAHDSVLSRVQLPIS